MVANFEFDKKEIYTALHVLNNVCSIVNYCEECPLGDETGSCKVQHQNPRDYKITDTPVDTWRALD